MKVMKVFISSTYSDLIEYRQAAIEVVNDYKCVVLAMEHFKSQPQEPKKVCDDEIEECDIFVGIYAYRFGFIPKGKKESITQLEYELAKKEDKDCLCFIVKKAHPWNPDFIEHEKRNELNVFLDKVKKEKTISSFTTVDDFKAKLSVSLGKVIDKKKGINGKEIVGRLPSIPLPPAPYAAHPYPLPDYFTGREAEKAMLSNWFFNEREPLLVLEAVGGMGKSALSWVWLHQQVMDRGAEVEGVFWWSFYEAPFDTFLRHLACYVLGSSAAGQQKDTLSIDLDTLNAILYENRFLLVLDGFERALRGYAGMEAMYIREKGLGSKSKKEEEEWDKRLREPVHPAAARFLQHLAAGRSKVLVTTRLHPTPLEDLSGVKHVFLSGLSPTDAVTFFKSQGIQGTRAELEEAGRVYNYHPLLLKLLAASIQRSRGKDIKAAYKQKIIDRKEPQKILNTTFGFLSKEERQVAAAAAVFRGVFTFAAAGALFPKLKEEGLWQVLQELCCLGFLFYDNKEEKFDFHPILRSFLYDRLTDSSGVHQRAVEYFQALPKVEKVISLDDLTPVIELYHHLVKAGQFDEALRIFKDRITDQAYFQFSAYQLCIDLLLELFPEGEKRLPRLKKEADQAWTLNDLANSYSLSGQPEKAVPMFLLKNKLNEKNDDKENLAIGLGNVADDQLKIGQLSAAAAHLRKEIALGLETEDEFEEAKGRQELGLVLALQGREAAADELAKSTAYWQKSEDYQGLSLDHAYRSLSALLQARLKSLLPGQEKAAAVQAVEALNQAGKALEFAEKTAKTVYPLSRDFVEAYWLLGDALCQCRLSTAKINPFGINFYDEYFQQARETLQVKPGREPAAAKRCLDEALRRCRKANMVEMEADILLALCRLGRARGKSPVSFAETLAGAEEIARRSGYRLKLADIHLFCGQVLLEQKEEQTLLGLSAAQHLQKARDYALDVSEPSHLYQSKDPHFYDGNPEYDMLERGMSPEERKKNGYYPVYRMVEELMRKLHV